MMKSSRSTGCLSPARSGRFAALAGEQGSVLLEFALAVPVFVTAVIVLVNTAVAVYAAQSVATSAEEAARYAMVRGLSWKNAACTTAQTEQCTATSANVTSYVQSIAPPGMGASLSVSTTWSGLTPSGASCTSSSAVNSPGCVVTVRVGYTYHPGLSFIPASGWSFSGTSTRVILR